jgi:hypothetical protein
LVSKPLKEWWIVKGEVSDDPDAYDEAYGEKPKPGDVEWQFSDGPPGKRGYSEDYLSLEAGLAALAPAIFHWAG